MENLSLKSPEPDSFRDGHRALEKAIPSAQWYSKPKWLDHRCRTYAKTKRQSWTNRQGKVYFYQKWPERYIRQEFTELIYSAKPWGSLFDHWGRLTLADGRVALFSSPYVDDYATALAFAEALGLELLSKPGDLSHYGGTSHWYLFAEPQITTN